MKYFISMEMRNRTNEEIESVISDVENAMSENNPKAERIDSFFLNAPHDTKPLWFLGKSLELLSEADLCIFVDDANHFARGCKVESLACELYGIDCATFRTDTKSFESNGC